MPALTRKRKAELEAAGEGSQIEAQLHAQLEADTPKRPKRTPTPKLTPKAKIAPKSKAELKQPEVVQPEVVEPDAEEPPSKRQKQADPYKRTDPFRPFTPPLQTVTRRAGSLRILRSRNTLKRVTITKKKHPLPVVFYTVPTANPENQLYSKGRSSNDVGTIMATKSLLDHAEKHGVAAMPSEQALGAWLEEHKNEFVKASKAREARARRQTTPIRRVQNSPRTVAPNVGAYPATPATQHPAARPLAQHQFASRAPNGGVFRKVVRYARRAAARLLSRAAAVLQDPVVEESVVEPQHQPAAATVASKGWDVRVRPIAPPLDERFFHPNGQVHTVYKYLTAQIPLPRQWVKWAIENEVHEVPGRGDIRGPGTYVAEDTYNYDLLYEAIHRGFFRTGRLEIDEFPEHWPMVEGRRDAMLVDLDLHLLTPRVEQQAKGKGKGKEPAMPSTPVPELVPSSSPEPLPLATPSPTWRSAAPLISAPVPSMANHDLSTIKEESESPGPIGASTPRRSLRAATPGPGPNAVVLSSSLLPTTPMGPAQAGGEAAIPNPTGTYALPDNFYDTTEGASESTIIKDD